MSTADAPKDPSIRSASLGSKNLADRESRDPDSQPSSQRRPEHLPKLVPSDSYLNGLFSAPLIFEKYSLRLKAALPPNHCWSDRRLGSHVNVGSI